MQCNLRPSSARPTAKASMILWACCSVLCQSKYLMNISAGLSFPNTLLKFNRCAEICWIHDKLVSLCLVCPGPFLFIMPTAGWASPQISPDHFNPKSLYIETAPHVSAAARNDACNSDSPELKAIRIVFLLQPLIAWLPAVIVPPVVGFLMDLQPAPSASL